MAFLVCKTPVSSSSSYVHDLCSDDAGDHSDASDSLYSYSSDYEMEEEEEEEEDREEDE